MAFLLRDWEQVYTLRLIWVCLLYDYDTLRVHSHRCIILSPTTTSKIGHLKSGRAITLSALTESDWEERMKTEKRGGEE